MLGEKYFKACTRGLDRFNKNEPVLVRNDHQRVLTTIAVRQPTKIVSFCFTQRNPELDGDVALRTRSVQRAEGQVGPEGPW